jgi:hypothetical protein
MKRYLNVILIGLIIVTAIVGFYVLYPKYQFVVIDKKIFKMNRITGKIIKFPRPVSTDDWVEDILSGY